MNQRTRFVGGGRGKSRLEGCNFGEYPIHKFFYTNDPEPICPLWAFACGRDEWRRECFRERRCSDTFAVEYVQDGIFVFQQNHVTMKIHPGEIFLVHLDQDNSMRCETDFAVKRTVIMRGPLLRSVLETLGLDRIDRIVPKEHDRIDRLFDQLESAARIVTQPGMRESGIACYALLMELAEQAELRRRPAELCRALEYIHGHLNEPPRLEDLIRHSGASSATLHRQFRKYLNSSPIAYHRAQKLERARFLLENTPCSVKETAEMLSYASPQYFAAEFKKRYGVPPKHFKYRVSG